MENQKIYQKARKRAVAKLAFYKHLAIYVVVNLLLLTINITTSAAHLWFVWPLLGWGIGVISHGLKTFLFQPTSGFKDRMIEKELDRLLQTDNK